MTDTSQQQTAGQPTGQPPATPPLTSAQPSGGQSSNTPKGSTRQKFSGKTLWNWLKQRTGFSGKTLWNWLKQRTGFSGKTLWDWLGLAGALLVPFMIGVFTIASTIQQSNLGQQQHATDLQIAQDQQQATILQTYIDNIQDLLLNHDLLRANPNQDVAIVARARTLTALRNLDPARKGFLLQFLYEANLISNNNAIVSLNGADLSHADLRFITLNNIDLSGANLKFADLSYANLTKANLHMANLFSAILSDAILDNADLSFANLRNAQVTGEQLKKAQSLTGTHLPDGSIYHP